MWRAGEGTPAARGRVKASTGRKDLEAQMAGLRMAHGLWQGAGAMTVGLVTGVAVAACAAHPSIGGPRQEVSTTATTAAVAKGAAKSMPYNLYTHCGISEVRVGNKYYTAVRPLSDGSGNPPPGWANPYQAGTMTLVSATEAVFTDSAGHHVVFTVRPGARTFMNVCS
jgi:hypothetical protein